MEAITVKPAGDTDIGEAVSTITQMKAAGLVQGLALTNDGIVVHLWSPDANRVQELGGFDEYVALLEKQFEAKGLKRVVEEPKDEKAAEE